LRAQRLVLLVQDGLLELPLRGRMRVSALAPPERVDARGSLAERPLDLAEAHQDPTLLVARPTEQVVQARLDRADHRRRLIERRDDRSWLRFAQLNSTVQHRGPDRPGWTWPGRRTGPAGRSGPGR